MSRVGREEDYRWLEGIHSPLHTEKNNGPMLQHIYCTWYIFISAKKSFEKDNEIENQSFLKEISNFPFDGSKSQEKTIPGITSPAIYWLYGIHID